MVYKQPTCKAVDGRWRPWRQTMRSIISRRLKKTLAGQVHGASRGWAWASGGVDKWYLLPCRDGVLGRLHLGVPFLRPEHRSGWLLDIGAHWPMDPPAYQSRPSPVVSQIDSSRIATGQVRGGRHGGRGAWRAGLPGPMAIIIRAGRSRVRRSSRRCKTVPNDCLDDDPR
jgi:hypothetical protein